MSEPLKTQHPCLMVPHVISFSVVLYTNGPAPAWPQNMLEEALIAACPPGTGVGSVTCMNHGVYDHKSAK